MDFDLEIISEEDDCPNHLFESIMSAMDSMKEATADKIYHKIQRDGETNYSKPQVDKALANALKYGIFEVRNNRYRVRDDILDDEDNVYWKLHEKKDRTPFRIQEHLSEKQFGLKLDPERDNQRFRKMENTEPHQCPHCGRIKKLKQKNKSHFHKKSEKLFSKKKIKNNQVHRKNNEAYRISGINRKGWHSRRDADSTLKKKKTSKTGRGKTSPSNDKLLNDFWIETKHLRERGSLDSRYSNMNFLEADGSVEKQDIPYKQNEFCPSQRFPESEAGDEKRSSMSKSDMESECSLTTQNLRSQEDFWDSITNLKEKKTSLRNETKCKNLYMRSMNEYHRQYDNDQAGQHKGKPDWLGSSDEPQGTIRQSNNVLTIEPMDTLAFESPEKASYIT